MDTLILFTISSCVIGTVYPLIKSDFVFYSNLAETREQAKINCEKEGKKLIRIENSQKWESLLLLDVTTITPILSETVYWIGLQTFSSDCTGYVWGGWEPTCPYTNWQDRQPTDCGSNKCVKVDKGKWYTAPCNDVNEKLPYICEKIKTGICTGNEPVPDSPTTTTPSTTTTTVKTTTTAADTTTTTLAETITTAAEPTTTSVETTKSVADTITTPAETTTSIDQISTTSTETTKTPTSGVVTTATTSVAETNTVPSDTTTTSAETTTERLSPVGEDTSTTQQPTGSGNDGSVVTIVEYQSMAYTVTDGIATATPDLHNPTHVSTTTSQAGVGGFVEYLEKNIVATNLVSSVANPVALTITGNEDSCKQYCLDTEMNSFQCWAVTITSVSSNECILYYIDEPANLHASSVLVIAAGSVVFLKSQASVPTLGTACSCKMDFNWDPPGNISEQYMSDLLDKLLQLKGKLSIKKNETQKYQRTLISAEDKRASSVGIGSMGIALLVVIFGFVVVADITHFISLFKFLKRCCQRKEEAVPP